MGKRKRATITTDELLESLTLDQLWKAQILLDGGSTRPKTREAAKETLLRLAAPPRLREAVLEIEGAAPKNHCFFAQNLSSTKHNLNSRVGETFDDSELARFVATEEATTLTFERHVIAEHWPIDPNNPNQRTKVTSKIRLPVFVWLDASSSISIITFDGFTPSKRGDYENIVETTLKALAELGVRLRPLEVRSCIQQVIESGTTAIRILNVTNENQNGRLALAGRFKHKAIEDVLQASFGEYKLPEDAINAFRKAMESTACESVCVHWTDSGLSMRVEFWSNGADFLFLGGAHKDFSLLKRDITALYNLASKPRGIPSPWTFLTRLPEGAIVRPADYESRFANRTLARKYLMDAVSHGFVIPIYRLNASDRLRDALSCDWRRDISYFRNVFRFENEEIDGGDPRNIEVAFERTAAGNAQRTTPASSVVLRKEGSL